MNNSDDDPHHDADDCDPAFGQRTRRTSNPRALPRPPQSLSVSWTGPTTAAQSNPTRTSNTAAGVTNSPSDSSTVAAAADRNCNSCERRTSATTGGEMPSEAGETTNSSSSGGESGAESNRTTLVSSNAKKRKPTYYVRKEEKAELLEEIDALQARVRELEVSQLRAYTSRPLVLHEHLQAAVTQNHLSIATTESLLSSYKTKHGTCPLDSYIHLTTDLEQRQRVLREEKGPSLQRATDLMMERLRFLNLRCKHNNVETFDLPNGEYVLVSCDVTPFEGRHSVEQVLQEFLYFVGTQEISISENLGIITVSEVDEAVPRGGAQGRLLSTIAPGVEVEMNIVKFFKLIEDPGLFGHPYAIAALDYVNQDDLYPYNPARLRRDMSAAAMILMAPPEEGKPDSQPIVTLARWAFVRMHPSTTPLSPDVARHARESMTQWETVMLKVLTERLASKADVI